MALNKYMHPRNIYKIPPDFVLLAKTYTEFSDIAKTDITGKVTVDFKDAKSLRVLTKCLLKHDFDLDVIVPEDRLVPTLPSRLNYVLWIEDLLQSIGRDGNITGLDIGTGACAIYPLLAASKNKWCMIGTETDEESFQIARDNVNRNNLNELVQVRKNDTSSLIEYLFEESCNNRFDFCMCNPPFYSSIQELYESRSPARPPPKNGFTGSPHELVTEGGELDFCRKLIKESKQHKNEILIFTTMVGHKFNLNELLQDLKEEGINYTHTEFCQGRVTRWGVAWTYQDYDLFQLLPPRQSPRKKNTSLAFLLPPLADADYNLETMSKKIMSILDTLKIDHKIIVKRGNKISLDITAFENTWSNQRRKRRLLRKLEESKRAKIDTEKDTSITPVNALNHSLDAIDSVDGPDKSNSIDSEKDRSAKEPIVRAFFNISKKSNDVILETDYLNGTGGKESVHQIVQYIKNNWK